MFPSLKTRPLHFASSGAGFDTAVCGFQSDSILLANANPDQAYFAKHYFDLADPPVTLRKIAPGNPSIQDWAMDATVVSVSFSLPTSVVYVSICVGVNDSHVSSACWVQR